MAGRVLHLDSVKGGTTSELVVGEYAPDEVRLHLELPEIGTVKGDPDEILAWVESLASGARDLVARWRAGEVKPRKAIT